MWMGNLKVCGATVTVVLAVLALSACGSGNAGPDPVQPALAPATADELAKLSDRIASDLDAGDTCHAAHAADDLKAAVEQADLPDSMRGSIDETAGRLVDEVNCPPPPPPPEPKKKPKDEHKHEGDKKDHHGDENKPPGHGGVPPGQAKLGGGVE
jgi:hypothetical protein